MNIKEVIYYSNDEFIEKIAHEVAMASAIEEFKESFSCNMINPIHESNHIINLYYQHKRRAIFDIINNYECKSI